MSALSALKELVAGRPTGYTPSINPFLQIDVDLLARELRLEELGTARGKNNLPPSNALLMDDIEHQVIDRIEEAARQSFSECVNELRVIDNRLVGLDLMQRFSQVQSAAGSAIVDFHATARAALIRLDQLSREVQLSHGHITAFRAEHRLHRPVQEAITGVGFWGIVLGAVLVEALLNSTFLRINDDFGLLGGMTLAFAIAAINVLVATLTGMHATPLLHHMKAAWKIVGVLIMVFYFLFALGLNLLGAHYRSVKGAGAADPGSDAISSFLASPFHIHDFLSFLLLVLGLGASIVALVAGYRKDDPYPGYGRVAREHQRILDDYSEGVEEAQDELAKIRDEAVSLSHTLRNEMARDRREFDTALLSRSSIVAQFGQRHPYLEGIGNRLLSIYRTANQAVRTESPPTHFSKRWTLAAMQYPSVQPFPDETQKMDAAVQSTDRVLEHAIQEMNEALLMHIKSFHKADDLISKN